MRIVYVPESESTWEHFYGLQASQSGHGISGFEGTAFQRGSGLGNILGRIFRSVFPILKSVGKKVAKTVGKEAFSAGANIVGDIARGRNFQESAKEHGLSAVGNLADGTANYIKKQSGRGLGRPSKKSTLKAPARKRKAIVKKSRGEKRSNTADILNDKFYENV